MLQRWESLTFLHWKYDARAIQTLLPSGLKLDTFEGAAWVGLAPFIVSRLRPNGLPSLPWLGRFPETNVRTYVTGPDGKPGVWFFTLEADRLLAVLGARLTYGLPYRWARMSVRRAGEHVAYASDRQHWFGRGFSRITVRPGELIERRPFDNFLTARFRLYSVFRNRVGYGDIEHEPWPLRTAEVLQLDQNLFENSGVPRPSGDPIVHFSQNLDVRIDRLRMV